MATVAWQMGNRFYLSALRIYASFILKHIPILVYIYSDCPYPKRAQGLITTLSQSWSHCINGNEVSNRMEGVAATDTDYKVVFFFFLRVNVNHRGGKKRVNVYPAAAPFDLWQPTAFAICVRPQNKQQSAYTFTKDNPQKKKKAKQPWNRKERFIST